MDTTLVKATRNVKVINFNAVYEPPDYTWNKAKNMITWGKNNDYPSYLLNLYNYRGSSRHTSIINRKVRMTVGNGFNPINDMALLDFVTKNDLLEEVERADIDYEIFNGFAFEVIWSMDGKSIASMKHIPISQLRFGLCTKEMPFPYFWYCKDWTQTRKFQPEPILSFEPDYPEGKQIVYFSTYNPLNVLVDYPIAYYSTSLNAIETDYEISRFHLNQAKQGYAPSFLLNFATGIPSVEEQEEFYKAFEAEYSGTENAGKAIITYSQDKDHNPTFEKVELNDSDERFLMLQTRIENDIIQGSGMPPQLVMLTPGQLGSTQERTELMVEFQQSYIGPRQGKLEAILNKILSVNNYTEKLTLATYMQEGTNAGDQPVITQ